MGGLFGEERIFVFDTSRKLKIEQAAFWKRWWRKNGERMQKGIEPLPVARRK